MKKIVPLFIIIICTLFQVPALAEQARQLSWTDLVPTKLLADDSLANLTPDQQELVISVVNMLRSLPKQVKQTEEFYKEIDKSVPSLRKAGVDIVKLMAKIKEIQTSVVEELNGQRVRIPGYLLPLEMSGTKVTEFLLVPYVGACIHVPPPPPNQIILVKIAAGEGYDSKKLYEPVWVTGVISVQSMVKDLFLVDGKAGIDIGYSMQANRIEPYKE